MDADRPPARPRWVNVLAILAAALMLVFLFMHVTGHGMGGHTNHGP